MRNRPTQIRGRQTRMRNGLFLIGGSPGQMRNRPSQIRGSQTQMRNRLFLIRESPPQIGNLLRIKQQSVSKQDSRPLPFAEAVNPDGASATPGVGGFVRLDRHAVQTRRLQVACPIVAPPRAEPVTTTSSAGGRHPPRAKKGRTATFTTRLK